VVRHDLVTDDFPAGSFDFIHARTVLMHIRERQATLSRMVGRLAPGGVILIEDLGVFVGETSVDPDFRKMMTPFRSSGLARSGRTRGTGRVRSRARSSRRAWTTSARTRTARSSPRARLPASTSGPQCWACARGSSRRASPRKKKPTGFLDLGLVMMSMWGRRQGAV
jgi:SAM-dependent methyltransferase